MTCKHYYNWEDLEPDYEFEDGFEYRIPVRKCSTCGVTFRGEAELVDPRITAQNAMLDEADAKLEARRDRKVKP